MLKDTINFSWTKTNLYRKLKNSKTIVFIPPSLTYSDTQGYDLNLYYQYLFYIQKHYYTKPKYQSILVQNLEK